MAMVARHMEKRDSVRDADHEAPSGKITHPPAEKPKGTPTSPLISPVTGPTEPALDPEWHGIAVSLLKDYGEAEGSPKPVRPDAQAILSAAPAAAAPADTHASDGTPKADAHKLEHRAEVEAALIKEVDAVAYEKAIEDEERTSSHAKRQIEALQLLLKQEREARTSAESMVKELTLETQRLRDELSHASVNAATARAALEAREELLAHLKEEVTELRGMFKARA